MSRVICAWQNAILAAARALAKPLLYPRYLEVLGVRTRMPFLVCRDVPLAILPCSRKLAAHIFLIFTSSAGVELGIYLQMLVDILADDHRMHTSGAEISGTDLTLTLDTPISQGQSVTVTCDNFFTSHLPGLLTGKAGNALGHFTGQSVTNNSTAAANEDAIWPVLSEHSLTVAEGGTSTYTIAQDSQPEEDVTVSLTISPGGHLTADLTELTFTTENWETAQTVTLTEASDEDDRNAWQEIIHTSEAEGFVAGHGGSG